MRRYFGMLCAVLVVGCQSPTRSYEALAASLTRRITPDEARHILFDLIDRDIQAAEAHDASRTELAVLSEQRQLLSSRFDSFLRHSRAGDELWDYRTYVTADHRGGNSGFALLRDGRVVEQMVFLIHD
jgi:hypothetical protein